MELIKIVSFFIKKMVDIIYPNCCGICDEKSKEVICDECYLKINLEKIDELIENNNNDYKQLVYIFKYEGIIRERIIKYKFGNRSDLYKCFSKLILESKSFRELLQKYDSIIPVPISSARMKERGYNQCELIVKEIARNTNLRLENGVIYKIKNIKPQSKLNKMQRTENVKDAYEIRNANKIIGKKVLLFDDIFTTGNTVKECSKLLKNIGVEEIGIIVIAKDFL